MISGIGNTSNGPQWNCQNPIGGTVRIVTAVMTQARSAKSEHVTVRNSKNASGFGHLEHSFPQWRLDFRMPKRHHGATIRLAGFHCGRQQFRDTVAFSGNDNTDGHPATCAAGHNAAHYRGNRA